MKENIDVFVPISEERALRKEYEEARKNRDRKRQEAAKKDLVHLYIQYGEFFKMSNQPDLKLAEKYMRKALSHQKDHPVAHYRLAHLCYRQKEYGEAIYHFQQALTGSIDEALNETQVMLANMFLVNCGIYITREALKEVEYMEGTIQYDENRVGKYKSEIIVSNEEMLERIFYRKITPTDRRIISEEDYDITLRKTASNEVLLLITDHGYEIRFGQGEKKSLELPAFYILYTVLTTNQFITNREIITKVFKNHLERDMSDEAIRQSFSRMRRNLPFWDEIIETKSIGNKSARNRKDGITFTVLCRASDILPDEI